MDTVGAVVEAEIGGAGGGVPGGLDIGQGRAVAVGDPGLFGFCGEVDAHAVAGVERAFGDEGVGVGAGLFVIDAGGSGEDVGFGLVAEAAEVVE